MPVNDAPVVVPAAEAPAPPSIRTSVLSCGTTKSSTGWFLDAADVLFGLFERSDVIIEAGVRV